MPRGHSLRLTPAAAAELCRQAAVAGTPGLMHLELLEGACEAWAIRLCPGHLAGTPVARADGITLYSPAGQLPLLQGLQLDYRGDLSGGGFLVRPGPGVSTCACGAAFSRQT
ncbi:AIR synthase [Cyanobium gracile]|uniref:AIR synthase n=1 Tax=Cyanobium gracile UHCC 0281 TaxID=3110309 RepID=A0ABU5SY13_9CYAN|nr:AIR synthase [Cyanobium gracile]MEA5443384.1 AIR synthase [Cyanobium gracile UHCC 0281]